MAATLAAADAHAHDHWLELDGDKVYLLVGEALDEAEPVRPRSRQRYTRFELRGRSGARDLLGGFREDEAAIATTGPLGRGTWMVALDAGPRDIELEPRKFEAYLLEERLIDILVARVSGKTEDAPGRERYSRYLKAVLRRGDRSDDRWVTRPIGQVLEIVPGVDPTSLHSGALLPVQVLLRGKPLVGRAVTAVVRRNGRFSSQTVRTDREGRARFRVDRSGTWIVRLVHMEPSHEASADWRTFWASMTFALEDGS